MSKNFVNIGNTKRPDKSGAVYHDVIRKITKDKVCPFCKENLHKYHKHPIIEENNNWLATKNMYPYKGTKNHFLLIHKKHITRIEDMSKNGWLDLNSIIKSMTRKYNIKGGTFFIRFGETSITGASVEHLHAHLVSTKKNNKEPVLARIG